MWKVVETKAKKTRIAEVEGGKKKDKERKEENKKTKK